MKKDPNRFSTPIESGEKPDFSLPKSRILRGTRNFQRLFEKSTVVKTSGIQFRYRIYNNPSEGCLVGFIAKKRLGKAAKRNRLKRLMREVYRTHQHLFTDLFATGKFGFHGVFMAQKELMTYDSVREQMISLMKDVRSTLIQRFNLQVEKNNKHNPES